MRPLFPFNKLCVFASVLISSVAWGNPVLSNVNSGNVNVTQSYGNTVVNQSSQKAIINWSSFNIAAGEKTQFVQPNASSVALNRINPNQGASQIYGTLTANGKIILVNGAGIHFGPSAMVNVGGIIASTSDISNANFLAGNYVFDKPSAYAGSILNEGTIIATNHGLVALIGHSVENNGMIQAELGNIVLASGDKFTLDFYGDQLINFSVDEGTTGASVKNDSAGTLLADGGKILVTAKTAEDVLDNVISMDGVAQAHSVSKQNGEIILDANAGGVSVTGSLDASGTAIGATGGTVKVLGKNIHLTSTASIDVSGQSGGGEVLVGGNSNGKGIEKNADTTTVDNGAIINANAVTMGDGGKVVVWSNQNTQFHGLIQAQGGIEGGNGGDVETSGGYLDVQNAKVITLAPQGIMGNWLLDPTDVVISTNADSNSSYASGTYTSSGNLSNILASELISNLSSSNVTITTTSGGAGTGNITVNTPLTWTSSSTLSLNAENNIYLNADITALNGGLSLSAVNGGQSITSGTIGSSSGITDNFAAQTTNGGTLVSGVAAIQVANFALQSGQWFQNANTLPNFTVTNNFSIASGSTYNNSNAEFTRLNSTGGQNGITDVFGLQGIATAPLSTDYQLDNNIDATVTKNWTGSSSLYTGFVPIGDQSAPYTGTFDGQNYVINNLWIHVSSPTNGGLFGVVSGASINNVGVTNVNVYDAVSGGSDNVGALAGNANNGSTFNNDYSTGYVTETTYGTTGGLIGSADASTISNSYNAATVTAGNGGIVGGFIGFLSNDTVSNSYSSGAMNLISPTDAVEGGFSGYVYNTSITNSYVSGPVANFISTNNSGAFLGSSSSNTLTGNFFDTTTTGISTGVSNHNVSGVTGMTTADMMSLANYNSATSANGFVNPNWNISTTPGAAVWGIIDGNSYPYLTSFYGSSTPRVISGFVSGASSLSTVTLAANSVTLSDGGGSQSTAPVASNGFYYFLEGNGVIPDTISGNQTTILAYLTQGGNQGNGLTLAPLNANESITGFNFSVGGITLGDTSHPNYNFSNSILANAIQTPSSLTNASDILYSASGNDLTFAPSISFNPGTSLSMYTINGALTLSGTAALTFNVPVVINNSNSIISSAGNQNYNNSLTLASDATLMLTGNNSTISINDGVNGGSQSLTLQNADNSTGDTFLTQNLLSLANLFVIGGANSNTSLIVNQENATWNITGANSGNLTQLTGNSITGVYSFTNISNIGNQDYGLFYFADGSSISGNVGGGTSGSTLDLSQYLTQTNVTLTGSDNTGFMGNAAGIVGTFNGITSLNGSAYNISTNDVIGENTSNTWTVTSNNNVTYNDSSHNLLLTNFGNLDGGTGNDTFTFTDGHVLNGYVDGGAGGTNILNFSSYTTDVGVSFTSSALTGYSAELTGTVVPVGSFFNITQINGGSGNNTLYGEASENAWNITSNNAGTFSDTRTYNSSLGAYTTISFNHFGNITGNFGNDNIVISDGVSISGNLTGIGGDTVLDLSAWTTPVSVNLATNTATGIGGSLSHVAGFIGNDGASGTSSTITGPNGTTTWDITGNNSGNVNSYSSNFSGFGNLVGGSGNNTYTFEDTASIAGSITGGGGTNILDFSNYLTPANVLLTGSSASGFLGSASTIISSVPTAILGSFSQIAQINGSSTATAASTLTGENTTNTWTITGGNSGTYNDGSFTLTFNQFGSIKGDVGNDTFVINDGTLLSGTIDGGAGGTNIIDFSAYTSASNPTLTSSSATGFSGTSNVANFANITQIIGGNSGSDTLTGENANSVWNITDNNSGTYADGSGNPSLAFSNFGSLTGGTANNTYTFTDAKTLSGSIDGGAGGTNILDLSNYTSDIGITFTHSTLTGYSANVSGPVVPVSNFTDITQINGGSGNNTLYGEASENAWNITSNNAGTFSDTGTYNSSLGAYTTISFNHFGNITGNFGNDNIVISDGVSISGNLTGIGGDTVLDLSAWTTPVSVNLATNTATGIGGSLSHVAGFIGNDGASGTSSTITGPNGTTTWDITGNNSGNVNSYSSNFSGFGNLVGGSGNNTYTFEDTASIAGSITGGGGTNILDFSNYLTPANVLLTGSSASGFLGSASTIISSVPTAILGSFSQIAQINGSSTATAASTLTGENTTNTWTITGGNSGTYNDGSFTLTFNQFGSIKGDVGNDTFIVNDGTFLSGTIDGGAGGTNIIDFSAYTSASNPTLTSSSATGFSGTSNVANFANITQIIGGNSGSDTLTGENANSVWNITDNNSGTYADGSGNPSLAFSNFGSLTGGTANNTYTFTDAKTLSGSIDGGAGGTNILDLSNYTSDIGITFTHSTLTGYSANVSGPVVPVSNFTDITQINGGSGNNTLYGEASENAWNITSNNAGTFSDTGTYNSSLGAYTTISFNHFGNITGNFGNDNIVISDGVSISGNLTGIGGDTVLDLSAWTTPVSVNLATNTATGIGGSLSHVAGFIGNDGASGTSSTITGPNGTTTWDITGNNSGNVNSYSSNFSGFGNLVGGSGNNTYTFEDTASIAGSIIGGGGTNILDFSNYLTPANVLLTGSSASGFLGSASTIISSVPTAILGSFSQIAQINGSSTATATSTLTGENTTNTWTITGGNSGTYNDNSHTLTFSNFGNLTGGTGNDTFVIADGEYTYGTLDGGAGGVNILDASAYTTQSAPTISGSNATGFSGTSNVANFVNITQIIGGNSGSDTLTGENTNSIWNITDNNSGTYNDGSGNTPLNFSNFGSLSGGVSNDTFNFTDGKTLSGTVDGGASGTNILNFSSYTTATDLTLTSSTSNGFSGTGSIASFTNVTQLVGSNSALNTLTGENTDSNWNITGNNSGTYDDLSGNTPLIFSNFGSLTGGTSNNTYIFTNAKTLSGTINGGIGGSNILDLSNYTTATNTTFTSSNANGFSGSSSGITNFSAITQLLGSATASNTLTGENATNNWNITGNNSGLYNDTNGNSPLSFSNFANLIGGNVSDAFVLNGGTVSGTINGGSGNSTLTGDNIANTWIITGVNSGTVNGVAGGFTNMKNLIGGSSTDSFTLNGGSLSGSIDGGSGSNTLTAANVANTWNITGSNSGNVTGIGSFTNIQNLMGGTLNNTFIFADNASLSGYLNGGSTSATNTLNYTAYTTPVTVTMNTDDSGITQNSNNVTITNFQNINNLFMTNGSLKIANNSKTNMLYITSAGAGYLDDPINFSGVTTYISNPGTSTYVVFNPTANYNASNGTAVIGGINLTFINIMFNGSGMTSNNPPPVIVTTPTPMVTNNVINNITTNTFNSPIVISHNISDVITPFTTSTNDPMVTETNNSNSSSSSSSSSDASNSTGSTSDSTDSTISDSSSSSDNSSSSSSSSNNQSIACSPAEASIAQTVQVSINVNSTLNNMAASQRSADIQAPTINTGGGCE